MSNSECSDDSDKERDENIRKRKGCPEAWKKTARKQAHLHGEQYVTERGKVIEKKATGPDCT